jgi:hypothetical protein
MIRWIPISNYKGIIRSKLTWLFLGLCLVTFLVILRWPKEAEKGSIKTEEVEKQKIELFAEIPMTQEAVKEGHLPQEWASEEPEQDESDTITSVQGRVTNIDPYCTGMIAVDGIGFDAGSLDLTGVQLGDVVEITYTKQKHGKREVNVAQSVGVIHSSQQTTEVSTEEEPLREPEEVAERKGPTEQVPIEESKKAEPDVYPKTMQGLAGYEVCTGMFTVGGINFHPGSVDLTGIQTGDIVKITYTKNEHGLVLESLELDERR